MKDKQILKDKSIPEVAPKLIPPGYHDKLEKLKKSKDPETQIEENTPEETKDTSSSIEESKVTDIETVPQTEDSKPQEEQKKYEEEKKEYEEESICTAKKSTTENNKDAFEEEFQRLSKATESFSSRVNLDNPGEVATKLLMEVNEYSCQLFSLWNDYIQLLMVNQRDTVMYFKPEFHK